MTQATDAPSGEPSGKKRPLIIIALAGLLAGGGFASTYFGLWSPSAMLGQMGQEKSAHPAGEFDFIHVPRIEQSLTGGRGRSLSLSVAIETHPQYRASIEQQMPRLTDTFHAFVAGVDPSAYDKRGVLEIIRAEMQTRARLVLGEEPVKGLLITEFLVK